jgi:hypothetical protein
MINLVSRQRSPGTTSNATKNRNQPHIKIHSAVYLNRRGVYCYCYANANNTQIAITNDGNTATICNYSHKHITYFIKSSSCWGCLKYLNSALSSQNSYLIQETNSRGRFHHKHIFIINPLKPRGNYMFHLIYQ